MSENKYVVEYTRPANERAGTHLVLMLHGYGSQEHDLLSLAAHLPQEGFTYASMRAPQPVGSQFSADSSGAYIAADAIGYQWYPLNQQLESDQRAIEQAMVRHAPGEFAAVVGLSGYAVDSDSPYFKDEELKKTELPVFFGRDQEDPVIPQEIVNYTYDWIRKYTDGIKVLYAGIGHGVGPMEIRHVGEFLEVKVQGKEPRIRAQKVAEATGTVEDADA